jgi:hypothetical protein
LLCSTKKTSFNTGKNNLCTEKKFLYGKKQFLWGVNCFWAGKSCFFADKLVWVLENLFLYGKFCFCTENPASVRKIRLLYGKFGFLRKSVDKSAIYSVWVHKRPSTKPCFCSETSFRVQGCQMVCFQTKNPNLGKFSRVLDWKMFIYYMAIWNI